MRIHHLHLLPRCVTGLIQLAPALEGLGTPGSPHHRRHRLEKACALLLLKIRQYSHRCHLPPVLTGKEHCIRELLFLVAGDGVIRARNPCVTPLREGPVQGCVVPLVQGMGFTFKRTSSLLKGISSLFKRISALLKGSPTGIEISISRGCRNEEIWPAGPRGSE